MKTTQLQTHDRRPAFKDAWTPGDLVQFEALVSACALVAQSDGRVTPGDAAGHRADAYPACAVASADGGFDVEERAAILRICALLVLSPQEVDLVAPRRRPK